VNDKLLKIYKAIPAARMPVRADKSALGTLPVAAFKYCAAVTTASGNGWYVFPPLGFTVNWDGAEAIWTYDGAESWYPLLSTQYPDYIEQFDEAAPSHLKGKSPPFLSMTAQPGVLQIWSGLFVRTAPEWSLLTRPVVNYPGSRNYEFFEGIVETDRWFGPLFIVFRLTRQDFPITFRADMPLFQIQLAPRAAYLEDALSRVEMIDGLSNFDAEDWSAYEKTIVQPNLDPNRPTAAYAVRTRKREKSLAA
jgi:Family of unknown function (DUF6065)